MRTRRLTHRTERALAFSMILVAAALFAAAPHMAYAQRGGSGGGPGGPGQVGVPSGGGHPHTEGWRGGVPGGWRGAGPARWRGGFGWYAPGWPWGWGFPASGFAYAAPAPSPPSYRFLYDSPYYYPDYDSYHGFSYPP